LSFGEGKDNPRSFWRPLGRNAEASTGAGPTSGVLAREKGLVGRVEVMGELERAVAGNEGQIFDHLWKKVAEAMKTAGLQP